MKIIEKLGKKKGAFYHLTYTLYINLIMQGEHQRISVIGLARDTLSYLVDMIPEQSGPPLEKEPIKISMSLFRL